MSFDWSEYLDLAKELARQTAQPAREEARLRSAISRAYFAVFCRARNHLRTRYPHVPLPTDGTVHSYVPHQFAIATDAISRSVASQLARLRDLRNRADYDDTFPKLSENAAYALLCADTAFDALNNL
jgi:uncharacterized protein (UPF0332 family)